MPVIYQDVLATVFAASGYRTYLELGIGDGSMVRKIRPLAAYVAAVDIAPPPDAVLGSGGARVDVCKMRTDEFFATLPRASFDMIFIDADHAFESVQADLTSSIRHLSPDGVIALHDTDPKEVKYLHPGHCNDAHRIVDCIRARGDMMSITLPVGHEGLTFVRPRASRRVLRFTGGVA